jgi:hypothetical protein
VIIKKNIKNYNKEESMKNRIISGLILAILLFTGIIIAQDEELSDAEMEAIAQRDMLEYMVMNAPVRFDKNLQVGDKLVYRSRNDENEINSVEVIKDTLNAFWIKEEIEENVFFYLISRNSGELLDLKGYDEEGNFHHPVMLNRSEKETIRHKSEEKKESLRNKNIYTLENERIEYSLDNKTYTCKQISNSFSQEGENILISEEIPRMFPFSFNLELELFYNAFYEEREGLLRSYSTELINLTKGGEHEE